MAKFVRAWESADLDALVALLTDDVFISMPPMPFEYQGRDAAARFCDILFAAGRRFDLVPTRANGQPAFGAYLRAPDGIRHGTGLYVLTLTRNQISAITRLGREASNTIRAASSRNSGVNFRYSLPLDPVLSSENPKGSAVRKVGGTPRSRGRGGGRGWPCQGAGAWVRCSPWRTRQPGQARWRTPPGLGMLAGGGGSAAGVRAGRRAMLVFRLVCHIAGHWRVAGGEAHCARCSRCGTIAGLFDGSPPWVSAVARLAPGYGEAPPGFECPGCGRDGPLGAGEVLANDTTVRCRHRWICRHRWRARARWRP